MYGYVPPVRPDELIHYGIEGMHWGIRRFQPYPSDVKAKFKSKQKRNGKNVGAAFEKSIKNGKGKDNSSPAEQIAKEARNSVNSSANALRGMGKIQKDLQKKKPDDKVKKIPDDELRRRINRIQMERTYASLTAEEKKTGFEKVAEILDVVGSIAAIGVSIATVATAVHQLKKR